MMTKSLGRPVLYQLTLEGGTSLIFDAATFRDQEKMRELLRPYQEHPTPVVSDAAWEAIVKLLMSLCRVVNL